MRGYKILPLISIVLAAIILVAMGITYPGKTIEL